MKKKTLTFPGCLWVYDMLLSVAYFGLLDPLPLFSVCQIDSWPNFAWPDPQWFHHAMEALYPASKKKKNDKQPVNCQYQLGVEKQRDSNSCFEFWKCRFWNSADKIKTKTSVHEITWDGSEGWGGENTCLDTVIDSGMLSVLTKAFKSWGGLICFGTRASFSYRRPISLPWKNIEGALVFQKHRRIQRHLVNKGWERDLPWEQWRQHLEPRFRPQLR